MVSGSIAIGCAGWQADISTIIPYSPIFLDSLHDSGRRMLSGWKYTSLAIGHQKSAFDSRDSEGHFLEFTYTSSKIWSCAWGSNKDWQMPVNAGKVSWITNVSSRRQSSGRLHPFRNWWFIKIRFPLPKEQLGAWGSSAYGNNQSFSSYFPLQRHELVCSRQSNLSRLARWHPIILG